MSSKLWTPIGKAKCIKTGTNPVAGPITTMVYKITVGKIYDVLRETRDPDTGTWLLIVADDGLRGSYHASWFECPISVKESDWMSPRYAMGATD